MSSAASFVTAVADDDIRINPWGHQPSNRMLTCSGQSESDDLDLAREHDGGGFGGGRAHRR